MTKANECTCPSGDGSLRHPCPAHPAPVEQAGGDERAAFRPAQVISYRPGVGEVTIYVAGRVPGYMNIGDTVYVSDRAPVEQPIAALAQPSPDAPYADGIAADLERSNWTPEEALRWYAQGNHFDAVGGRTRIIDTGAIASNALKHLSLTYLEMKGDAELTEMREANAQPPPAQAEKAEAERPELWAVHAQGPDELYAAFTREDAEKHAAELNALPMPEGIAVGAVVVPSPWPEAEHWKYLAEQERDHKNEIAVRLRQFERICEGLPQDAIDGGWTVQGIRCYAKRLEDQLKSALARVAELEKQEPVATVAKVPGEDWNGLHFYRDLQGIPSGTKLYTAPVAQAQHSVPELDQLYSMLGAESQVDAAKKIAELIGCRMSRSALTEAQMRRIYENSTEIENERLGFAAFARLMRRAEAVHQIAAAPGKEGV
ncbi:hypothetical protein [Pseudomonas aeruginosa]|uniref:hypothetical protein n=1 Tax=Pseudomonas aeruginosa TaxID=287 RepID=UPI00163B6B4B|nr:hypothetical protein [Pseudomonas aeruginosa]